MRRTDRILQGTTILCLGFALLGMLFHNLEQNPHPDLQLVEYGFEFFHSIQTGTFFEYINTLHVYPMFASLLVGVPVVSISLVLILSGAIESIDTLPEYLLLSGPAAVHFTGRFVILCASLGSLFFLWKLSRKLFHIHQLWPVIILLFSSVLFVIFSTAIRPHILVTFFTVLTAYTSYVYWEKPDLRRMLCAYGSAGLAFAALHSGLFAFVFPLCASLFPKNVALKMPRIQDIISYALIASCVACITILLSYPYIITNLFHQEEWTFATIGQPEFREAPLNGAGFRSLVWLLFGDCIILCIFTLISLIKMGIARTNRFVIFICMYLLAYCVFFGVLDNVKMRFFIPIIPFIALFGVPSFLSAPRSVRIAVTCIVAFLHLKIGWLAIQPDTYQKTAEYILQNTSGVIATQVPDYFLGILPSKNSINPNTTSYREKLILYSDFHSRKTRDILPLRMSDSASVLVVRDGYADIESHNSGFHECFSVGKEANGSNGLLWSDIGPTLVDWTYVRLLTLQQFGPNIAVYCKS